uniref:ABC transporter domain-containing protein n=1 Tax=Hemiselmis andersenii TaxID=464988 RepID=A0A6U2IDY8_HEMAN|mmetsp:Transcript_5232/g.12132  ORF Transcript_5232/g.12132 Transcript_5232/m.12132 type:complete len:465 (+) Transcript_5232:519-1913(+)
MPLPEALDFAAAVGNSAGVEDAEEWRKVSVAAHSALEWRTARYDTTPLGQLSPGCAVRAYLALALSRRDVKMILLDEPTNHLDLPSILWLQHAIIASGKTVVVVSHDAAFLDAVSDHVWYIDGVQHTLTVSGAGYTDFVKSRELAREQQRAAYEDQKSRHKRLTGVANSLKAEAAAGARHVAKDNDKLQNDFKRDRAGRSGKKASAVEARRDREEKVEQVVDRKPLRITLNAVGSGTNSVIMFSSVALGYHAPDGSPLPLPLPPVSLRVDFGERVAIVGFNGVGKSTLLKTLMGEIQPLGGHVSMGRELKVGNLTQSHEALPLDATPRQYFSEMTKTELFATGQKLMKYGLTLRQTDCPISALNPGARARAVLASFAMQQVNTLILDEPTNHLDEEAMEEVLSTVNEYHGTVVLVTHSRKALESIRVTRTLRLGSEGLGEIESVDEFVQMSDQAARAVVRDCFG